MRFLHCAAALFSACLFGACLIAAPGHAAPAGALKGYVLPAQFGDNAPVIKVQRNPNNINQAPGEPPRRNVAPIQRPGVVAPGVQRQGGGGQRSGPPPGGQYQNRGGGQYHGGGYHGGGYYRGGDRRHDRDGDGGAVAAGVLGGLLVGAIIANESQRNDCARRPGYDPRSRTFVGPDRRRYRCP